MSVKVKIFFPELQRVIDGSDEVQVEGGTVGECLADLVRQFPQARKLLFDPQGKLFKPVYVFVNQEAMYKADLGKKVTDKDKLLLAVLATGG
jgi:hypothetical protein